MPVAAYERSLASTSRSVPTTLTSAGRRVTTSQHPGIRSESRRRVREAPARQHRARRPRRRTRPPADPAMITREPVRPAEAAAAVMRGTTCSAVGTLASPIQVMVPSVRSPASRSMPGPSAARKIGTPAAPGTSARTSRAVRRHRRSRPVPQAECRFQHREVFAACAAADGHSSRRRRSRPNRDGTARGRGGASRRQPPGSSTPAAPWRTDDGTSLHHRAAQLDALRDLSGKRQGREAIETPRDMRDPSRRQTPAPRPTGPVPGRSRHRCRRSPLRR